ncbi:MmcB family DNA repair protein [Roseateles chitosanitabidus]|uniref:MmcB family DNA repair protein n=1 Tax=Roseateles chitosanitabidus TaxID=65048 RepID=UPI000835EBE5|nr:MmcB family DNA repair protein [Roseateles chitosanitabidus]
MNLTHDQLATDLAEHLRGTSNRITWEDMQLGESGSPRPDVYTMEPTYTRLTFEAFECKVSVADFRRDVTAGKWQSYLAFANSVTFAAPTGLITKDMVPPTCGLILRGANGGWRYAKKPVSHQLTELPWKAWVKLLLDGVGRANGTNRATFFNEWVARRKLSDKFGAEVAAMLSDLPQLRRQLAEAQGQYESERKRLQEQLARDREAMQKQRDSERERCSDAVGRLAVAMGLPEDALATELQVRAQQMLALLSKPRFKGSPLLDLADELARVAVQARQLGEFLTSAPQPAEEAETLEDVLR